jgi:hypothetical protein
VLCARVFDFCLVMNVLIASLLLESGIKDLLLDRGMDTQRMAAVADAAVIRAESETKVVAGVATCDAGDPSLASLGCDYLFARLVDTGLEPRMLGFSALTYAR